MFKLSPLISIAKRCLQFSVYLLLLCTLSLGVSAPSQARESSLPAGNAITDGQALLRYALPINNPTVRELQKNIESIASPLRGKRWNVVNNYISKSSRIVRINSDELLATIPPERKAEAESIINQLKDNFNQLETALAEKDKTTIETIQPQLLTLVGNLEELMVSKYPFTIPAKYAYLPQLKGRATVEIETTKGNLTVVVDGYNAPITAGNFIDLVQRGFYNDLPFTRSEESYVLQTGDPVGPEEGFIDPKTGKYRSIPLEIFAQGDKEPIYGLTLEQLGRYKDQTVLPFSAYGTLALARPEPDNDGGSSQIFFFLFEPELTPAGLNLLDGRYGTFGYLVEGKDVLSSLKQGDKIITAKVVKGIENLVEPA